MTVDEKQNAIVALDSKGLCDILRVCAKSGVRIFEYGDLRIIFSDGTETSEVFSTQQYIPSDVGKAHPTETESPGQDDSKLFDREQLELDQLLIDDPYAYEQKVLSGELESGLGH